MKLDLKEWINKVSVSMTQPSVIGIAFSEAITSKTSGAKTASFTVTIPSGYTIVSNCRPVGLYVNGNATVSVTDRSVVSLNGTTASFIYYLHNPNNITGSLYIVGTILCRKVGG